MKTSEGQPRGRRAVRRQNRHAAAVARVDGDERPSLQRGTQIVVVGQLAVEIACESIIGDEHVRFAAQAPAERGMLPAAGAGQ